MNMTPKLNDPAMELSMLRCWVGNSSPISRNGMHPKPIEKPIMNTIKLTSGRNLKTEFESPHIRFRALRLPEVAVSVAVQVECGAHCGHRQAHDDGGHEQQWFASSAIHHKQGRNVAEQLHQSDRDRRQMLVNGASCRVQTNIEEPNGTNRRLSRSDLPDARKISTVKKMMESMPLICCSTSSVRPMDSGMKIGRVKITFLNLTSSPFVGAGLSIVASACAVADAGTMILFTSSFSQAADSSASLKRFCPRSHTGDSGTIDITMASDAANEQQTQPKTFHLAKVPTT